MVHLASVYYDEGRLPEAEKRYHDALEIRLRVLGPDHPYTLSLKDGYATTLAEENPYGEAEKLLRETLNIRQRVLGPDHRDTLMSRNNLANMLSTEKRYDEAEKLERETVEIQRRVLGPNSPDTAMSTYNLGGITLHKGNRDKALSLLLEAVDHALAPNMALQLQKGSRPRIASRRPSLRRSGRPCQRTRQCGPRTELACTQGSGKTALAYFNTHFLRAGTYAKISIPLTCSAH